MKSTVEKNSNLGTRLILVLVRYLLAVGLAYALSMLIVFFLLLRFPNLKNPTIALIGFVGVFLPSFILPLRSRALGAIFLLLLGEFYYCSVVFVYWEPLLPQIPKKIVPVLLLFAGGLIAAGFHYFFTRQKSAIRDKNHDN